METLPESIAGAIGSIAAAVTVCDKDLKLLFMNEKSAIAFESMGGASLVGTNLAECHRGESVEKMKKIIATGEPNVYTISKNGMKKIIWQGTWEKDGQVAGLVEISIPLPESMPHYDRG